MLMNYEKLLEQAIARLKILPTDKQDVIATLIADEEVQGEYLFHDRF
jgi:hypothetical protein